MLLPAMICDVCYCCLQNIQSESPLHVSWIPKTANACHYIMVWFIVANLYPTFGCFNTTQVQKKYSESIFFVFVLCLCALMKKIWNTGDYRLFGRRPKIQKRPRWQSCTIIRVICYQQITRITDCTEESRKDETCLQFMMNKYFIKTRKIYRKKRVALYYRRRPECRSVIFCVKFFLIFWLAGCMATNLCNFVYG